MAKEYVEERQGGYYVAGTRISLDSLVQRFEATRKAAAPLPENLRQRLADAREQRFSERPRGRTRR